MTGLTAAPVGLTAAPAGLTAAPSAVTAASGGLTAGLSSALHGPWSPAGAVAGLLAGAGLLLVLVRLPMLRRPTLEDRLAPYLRDSVTPSRLLPRSEDAVRGWLRRPAALADRWFGGTQDVRRRLDQLGGSTTPEQFRARQVVWGLAGAAAGLAAGVTGGLRGATDAVPLVAAVLCGALAGILAADQALSWRVQRRDRAMLAQFPAVAEILALAVAAGEGPAGALERVARTCRGELADELRRTVAEVRSGGALVPALDALANRTSLPALARFVDGIVVAVERGTPLAEVLRAQAHDVRELSRRELIESGGRREIAMMIPVVFGLLPVTVLFALYPGYALLDVGP